MGVQTPVFQEFIHNGTLIPAITHELHEIAVMKRTVFHI